jgi:hypothetical protein
LRLLTFLRAFAQLATSSQISGEFPASIESPSLACASDEPSDHYWVTC